MDARPGGWRGRAGSGSGQPRVSRRTLLRLFGGAALGVGGVAALGRGGAAASGYTPVPVVQTGEELTVAFTPDPIQMSPWLPNSMPGYSIIRHIYEPVVFRDRDMNLIPVLAESYQQLDDRTWEFKLRRGVRFHNGEELTSDAVKFSYMNIIAEGSKALWKSMLASIDRVETPDPYTARVVTKTVDRSLIRNMTLAGIMTERINGEIGENWARAAIGTGPYKFVEFLPAQRVVLERNDDYWGNRPAIKRIVVRIITENSTRLSALQSRDVLMVNNVPPDQIGAVEGASNLQVLSTPTARIVYTAFRCDRTPFNDRRVRQAANYAVDKEAIVQSIFRGRTQIATAPLAPQVFGASTELQPYPYDPDRARALLREAGTPNPKAVFGGSNGRYIADRQVSEAIAGYLEEVGFDIQFEAPEWGQYYAEVFKNKDSKYDMHLLAWGVINLEPDYQMREHFHSNWSLRTGYSNPDVDRLIDEADTASSDEQSKAAWFGAQRLVWEDCPWIWLYFQPEIHGVNRQLSGYAPRVDEYILFDRATIS